MNAAERARQVADKLAEPGFLPQGVVVDSHAGEIPANERDQYVLGVNLVVRLEDLSLCILWSLTAGLVLKLRNAGYLRGFVGFMIMLMTEVEGERELVRVMRFGALCGSFLRRLKDVRPGELLQVSVLGGNVQCVWYFEDVRSRLSAQRTKP